MFVLYKSNREVADDNRALVDLAARPRIITEAISCIVSERALEPSDFQLVFPLTLGASPWLAEAQVGDLVQWIPEGPAARQDIPIYPPIFLKSRLWQVFVIENIEIKATSGEVVISGRDFGSVLLDRFVSPTGVSYGDEKIGGGELWYGDELIYEVFRKAAQAAGIGISLVYHEVVEPDPHTVVSPNPPPLEKYQNGLEWLGEACLQGGFCLWTSSTISQGAITTHIVMNTLAYRGIVPMDQVRTDHGGGSSEVRVPFISASLDLIKERSDDPNNVFYSMSLIEDKTDPPKKHTVDGFTIGKSGDFGRLWRHGDELDIDRVWAGSLPMPWSQLKASGIVFLDNSMAPVGLYDLSWGYGSEGAVYQGERCWFSLWPFKGDGDVGDPATAIHAWRFRVNSMFAYNRVREAFLARYSRVSPQCSYRIVDGLPWLSIEVTLSIDTNHDRGIALGYAYMEPGEEPSYIYPSECPTQTAFMEAYAARKYGKEPYQQTYSGTLSDIDSRLAFLVRAGRMAATARGKMFVSSKVTTVEGGATTTDIELVPFWSRPEE